jgi:hypothetical protein
MWNLFDFFLLRYDCSHGHSHGHQHSSGTAVRVDDHEAKEAREKEKKDEEEEGKAEKDDEESLRRQREWDDWKDGMQEDVTVYSGRYVKRCICDWIGFKRVCRSAVFGNSSLLIWLGELSVDWAGMYNKRLTLLQVHDHDFSDHRFSNSNKTDAL